MTEQQNLGDTIAIWFIAGFCICVWYGIFIAISVFKGTFACLYYGPTIAIWLTVVSAIVGGMVGGKDGFAGVAILAGVFLIFPTVALWVVIFMGNA